MSAPYNGVSSIDNIPGVEGTNTTDAPGARGIVGICNVGIGVEGRSERGIAVYGSSSPHGLGRGVVGVTTLATAVEGNSRDGVAVWGDSINNEAVHGQTNSDHAAAIAAFQLNSASDAPAFFAKHEGKNKTAAVFEGNVSISGALGVASTGEYAGVVGYTTHDSGAGIRGFNFERNAHGTLGTHSGSQPPEPVGVYGVNWDRKGYAGLFAGNVMVTGALFKSGLYFRIDHPLDPANKYLCHSSVECPDMKNIYDGTVILDESGEAEVTFPPYVESLNEYFRYQLTAIGAASPNLHIMEEICDGCFKIAGGNPNSKVSWQVTGIRKDPYARKHPVQVEQEKPSHERGKYLHAEEYEVSETMGIEYEMKMSLKAELLNSKGNSVKE